MGSRDEEGREEIGVIRAEAEISSMWRRSERPPEVMFSSSRASEGLPSTKSSEAGHGHRSKKRKRDTRFLRPEESDRRTVCRRCSTFSMAVRWPTWDSNSANLFQISADCSAESVLKMRSKNIRMLLSSLREIKNCKYSRQKDGS